jgi:hypothetical protein
MDEKKSLAKSYNETDFDNDIPKFFNQAPVVKKKGALKKKGFCSSDSFLISHNNKYKGWWDLFMILVLLATCLLTPYNIAFTAEES